MVKQGDIIYIDFSPTKGHEQNKTRPALVISSDNYNKVCGGLSIICPISHANDFPYHIDLPNNLKTSGKVLCQHIRTVDLNAREYKYVESVPKNYIDRIIKIVMTTL